MNANFVYNSGVFLDREHEIEKFDELMQGKMPNKRLFQIHGISGQGKTELVHKACNMAILNDFITAYIDFEEGKFQTSDILPILEKLAEQIFKNNLKNKYDSFTYHLNDFFDEFSIYKNDFFRDPLNADKTKVNNIHLCILNEFLTGMVELIENQNRKIIICFDSIEKAFPDALKNLEKYIIKDMISYRNLFFIVSGQKLHYWKEYRIQDQIFTILLNRFDKSHTYEFIKIISSYKDIDIKNNEKYIFDKTWDLTLGHPCYTYTFLDLISEGVSNKLTPNIIDTKYKYALEIIIENYIYEQLPVNWKKHDNFPSLKNLFLLLSSLRHIEFGTFQFIIDTFFDDIFFDYTTFDFQTLMGDLFNNTYMFVYNEPGFDLEEATRNILLTYLKTDQPELYIRIQKILSDKYDLWVATSNDRSQVKNIIEHIYHFIMLNIFQENDDFIDIVHNKIHMYLKHYFNIQTLKSNINIIEQCARLKNSLKNDSELKSLINIEPIIVSIDEHMNNGIDTIRSYTP